jgi:hypothetical protein
MLFLIARFCRNNSRIVVRTTVSATVHLVFFATPLKYHMLPTPHLVTAANFSLNSHKKTACWAVLLIYL